MVANGLLAESEDGRSETEEVLVAQGPLLRLIQKWIRRYPTAPRPRPPWPALWSAAIGWRLWTVVLVAGVLVAAGATLAIEGTETQVRGLWGLWGWVQWVQAVVVSLVVGTRLMWGPIGHARTVSRHISIGVLGLARLDSLTTWVPEGERAEGAVREGEGTRTVSSEVGDFMNEFRLQAPWLADVVEGDDVQVLFHPRGDRILVELGPSPESQEAVASAV